VETAVSTTSIRGEIVVREPMGDEMIYTIQVGDSLIRATTEPTFQLSPGEPVGLTFDADRIHLFDAKTEKALVI
jgi:ABC-type sugar transport system ATPase subunit